MLVVLVSTDIWSVPSTFMHESVVDHGFATGVNAILYYSNAILGRSFPTLGPYVSLAITLVNMLMTVPAIFLINVCHGRSYCDNAYLTVK